MLLSNYELFKRPSHVWFEILSDLFVDLASALLVIVFIEPIFIPLKTTEDILALTSKLSLGILFLILVKKFREDSKK